MQTIEFQKLEDVFKEIDYLELLGVCRSKFDTLLLDSQSNESCALHKETKLHWDYAMLKILVVS